MLALTENYSVINNVCKNKKTVIYLKTCDHKLFELYTCNQK